MGKGQLRRARDVSDLSHCTLCMELRQRPKGQPQRVEGNGRVEADLHAPFTGDPLRLACVAAFPPLGMDGVLRRPHRVQPHNLRYDSHSERDCSARCCAGGDGAPSLPNTCARSMHFLGHYPTLLCQ